MRANRTEAIKRRRQRDLSFSLAHARSERETEGDVSREFDLLQEQSAKDYEEKSREVARMEVNKAKNRFVDIVPCEEEKGGRRSDIDDFPLFYIQMTTPWCN